MVESEFICLALSGCELDDLPIIHGGTAKKEAS